MEKSEAEAHTSMEVTCWGTCGSLPSPISHAAVRRKIVAALRAAQGVSLPDDTATEAVEELVRARKTYFADLAWEDSLRQVEL